jgi:photosystem II stability/assembly factor-like uncharacterized protein
MVSADTIQHTLFTLATALGLIFLIFVIKIPVACTSCDEPVGVWYRCFSGGDGSNTCDEGTSSNFSNQVKEIVKELIDAGIQLPKSIIDGVVYIRNKLVNLAVGIFDTIKSAMSSAFSAMSMVYNDYIKAPFVAGYGFIKDNVVLPIIQGITDYIVHPIQDLIQKIIGLKTTVFNAIKRAFNITRNIAVQVFDVTYGTLVDGFDQIPYGLVSFVETIQDVLNSLKNGIIGKIPSDTKIKPKSGLNGALYSSLKFVQDSVNKVSEGGNTVLRPVMNGLIRAANYTSLGIANLDLVDKPIPDTTFADDYKSWVPNPEDLFWAGTKSVAQSSIVTGADAICALVCSKQGYQTGTKNTNSGRTGECICTKNQTLTNNNALLSCNDVCDTIGGISTLPATPNPCPVCSNELIFSYNAFWLDYQFVISFENTPFVTFKSKLKFDNKITYTPTILANTLKSLLITDINTLMASSNILNEGSLTSTTGSIYKTAFDSSWLDFTVTNGIYSFSTSPVANTQLAAISTALGLTSVSVDFKLLFSTNSLMAQTFGFTADANVSSKSTTSSRVSTTFVVSETSATTQEYVRANPTTPLVYEFVNGVKTGNVIIPYQSQPVKSTTTTRSAFVYYMGHNFYDISGTYYVYMNSTFYKLNDQTIVVPNPSVTPTPTPTPTPNLSLPTPSPSPTPLLPPGFQYIQVQSSMNCAVPFSLKPYPNPNQVSFTYIDAKYSFTDAVTIPKCPISYIRYTPMTGAALSQALATGSKPFYSKIYYEPQCDEQGTVAQGAFYYTQNTFLKTLAWLISESVNTYTFPTNNNKILYRFPPFLFSVNSTGTQLSMSISTTTIDAVGNIIYMPRDASGNALLNTSGQDILDASGKKQTAVPLTASLTLNLTKYPIMKYNFNTFKDITITSVNPFVTSPYQINPHPASVISKPYLNDDNTFTLDTTNNRIIYSFNDKLNQYDFSGNTIIPTGTYTYDQIGVAFTNALYQDINANTDNFYNYNAPAVIASTSAPVTTNSIKFILSISPLPNPDVTVCIPYIPLPSTLPATSLIVEAAFTSKTLPSTFTSTGFPPLPTPTNNSTCRTYLNTQPSNACYNAYDASYNFVGCDTSGCVTGCNLNTTLHCVGLNDVSGMVRYVDPVLATSLRTNYNVYGEYIQLNFSSAFVLGEYLITPSNPYIDIVNSQYVVNSSAIDIYQVWIVGSNNNGATWYFVDNRSNINSVKLTYITVETTPAYAFSSYRIIITQMMNTPTPYPPTYSIRSINMYDSTFVNRTPLTYTTSKSVISPYTFPILINTTYYQPSTYYQGSIVTSITVGIPPNLTTVITNPDPLVSVSDPVVLVGNKYTKTISTTTKLNSQMSLSDDGSIAAATGFVFQTDPNTNLNLNPVYDTHYMTYSISGTANTIFSYNGINLYKDNGDISGNKIYTDKAFCSAVSGDGNYIYIGSSNGIYQSFDKGQTFTKIIITNFPISPTISVSRNLQGLYKEIQNGLNINALQILNRTITMSNFPYEVALIKCNDTGSIILIQVNYTTFSNSPNYELQPYDKATTIETITYSGQGLAFYPNSKGTIGVMLSTNNGFTFNTIEFLKGDKSPVSIAMSDDGRYQCVFSLNRNIYISSTYGYTWQKTYEDVQAQLMYAIRSPTDLIFITITNTISMSGSGQYLIIGNASKILSSNNYGKNWVLKDNFIKNNNTYITGPFPDEYLISQTAISNSGKIQLLYNLISKAVGNPNTAAIWKVTQTIYISNDYGISFVPLFSEILDNEIRYNYIQLSGDGKLIALQQESGSITFQKIATITTALPLPIPPSSPSTSLVLTNSSTITGSNILQYNASLLNNIKAIVSNSGVYYKSTGSWTLAILPSWSWVSTSISDSGQFLTAISVINGIYNSFDYGLTWKVYETTQGVNWLFVKISSTGQYGIACSTANNLFRTDDYGKTWGAIKIQSPASEVTIVFTSADLSITGQYQTLVTKASGVYFSSNYGSNWSNTSWTTVELSVVSVSANGKEQIVAGPTGIAYSSDYAQSFRFTSSGVGPTFKPVIIKQCASGKCATIACASYGLYITNDYSQTWYSIKSSEITGTTITMNWRFGSINNYSTLSSNGQIQLINEDGKYQVFCSAAKTYFSSSYGLSWDTTTSTVFTSGMFQYNFGASVGTQLNPTSVYFNGITTNAILFTSSNYPVSLVLSLVDLPNCYYSLITYTPQFVCNTQGSNLNVQTAKLTIKYAQMSKTLRYAMGVQSITDLSANKIPSDLVLFDNPGSYTGTVTPLLLLFDSVTPPFCGQDKEFKVTQRPNAIAYYFVSKGFAISNTLSIPVNPILDNYGTVMLGQSYTTELLISTVAYIITQDIKKQSGGTLVPYFNFTLNTTTQELRLGFISSFITPASLVLRTSQNLIMSNAFGADGLDLYISSSTQITYFPVERILGLDVINGMTDSTLTYTVSDVSGYIYYGKLINLPVNGNTVEVFLESVLPRLLVNDINRKTNNKYRLSSTVFKFQAIKGISEDNLQQLIMTAYNFYMNDFFPTLSITISFSENTEWARILGIKNDIYVFNLNTSKFAITSGMGSNLILDIYKSWYYYYLNNNYYFCIFPYLVKMNQLPSPSSEVPITREDLKTYLSFNTSTDKDDVYYWKANSDQYYVLIDENFVYPIEFMETIDLVNGDPVSNGYIEKKTPDDFTYYLSPRPDWYVQGFKMDEFDLQVNTMIKADQDKLLLITPNPNVVHYVFNSATITFSSSITLPPLIYSPELLATKLMELLTLDIQTRTPILDNAVQIQYEALNINKEPTLKKYTFTIQNITPFQLILKSGNNSILAKSLGVTSNITINPIYPPFTTTLLAVLTNPLSISYRFVDRAFDFVRFFTLPRSTLTPIDMCMELPLALMNDIVAYTGYPYTSDMISMSYDSNTNKYIFSINTPRTCTVTLQFNKTIGKLYERTIPPSTWASTLGCNAILSFSRSPVLSPKAAVPINPTTLSYSFTDNKSSATFTSNITFPDNQFVSPATGESILKDLLNLLISDMGSKVPLEYQPLMPSDFTFSYDSSAYRYTFSVTKKAFSVTLNFASSSLLGLNYGVITNMSFSTLNPSMSTGTVLPTYDSYNNVPMYMYLGQPSVFINTGVSNTTGLYGLVVGGQFCVNNLKCTERTLSDPNFTIETYGYKLQPTGYYLKTDEWAYDAKAQRLYYMISTQVIKFYGSLEDNDYTILTTCTLDSNGNCIPSSINIGKVGNQAYILLQKEVTTLLPFARDSLTETSCPCKVTAKIIPTCNEVCSSKTSSQLSLPGGSNDPLLCENPNDDPLQSTCKCYYNGPVNVIIKPMQQYNPFRLLTAGSSSGSSSFLTGVSNAVKSFMLPLWNTVKQVTAFLSSIIAMIVEAISTYANPVYVFNLFKNIAALGAEAAADQFKTFWDEIVVAGLGGIWNYRLVLIKSMNEGLSWIWENFKLALKALSEAISNLAVSAFGVAKTGITFIWEKFTYYTSAIIDTVTPFIPISPTIKFNIFLWIAILVLGAFVGLDELLITLYDTASITLRNATDSVSKVTGILKSIVTGS